MGPDFDCQISDLKLSELKIKTTGPIKLELSLICRIAESLFVQSSAAIDAESISALSIILLGIVEYRIYHTSCLYHTVYTLCLRYALYIHDVVH